MLTAVAGAAEQAEVAASALRFGAVFAPCRLPIAYQKTQLVTGKRTKHHNKEAEP